MVLVDSICSMFNVPSSIHGTERVEGGQLICTNVNWNRDGQSHAAFDLNISQWK